MKEPVKECQKGVEPVALRGIPLHEARRLRRREAHRRGLRSGLRRYLSAGLSGLVHLLLLALLAELVVIVTPKPEEKILTLDLKKLRVDRAAASKTEPENPPVPVEPDPDEEEAVVKAETVREETDRSENPESARGNEREEVSVAEDAPSSKPAASVASIRRPVDPSRAAEVVIGPGVINRLDHFSGGGDGVGEGGGYGTRRGEARREAVFLEGGTEASEAAVAAALDWLARHQDGDGGWRAAGYGDHCHEGGVCGTPGTVPGCSPGLTGLALLAYLGAGHTHHEGDYRQVVDRAIRHLIRCQGSDGEFHSDLADGRNFYLHGVVSYALSEAYGMTGDRRLVMSLERAMRRIGEMQNPHGGWDYFPRSKVVSEFTLGIWQMMAMKTAADAGIALPGGTLEKARAYVAECARGDGAFYYAWREDRGHWMVSPGSVAAGAFARIMLGVGDERGIKRSANYLKKRYGRRPCPSKSPKLYYWYYRTMVEYQLQGSRWREWNRIMRRILVERQEKEGHARGSWDMADYPHAGTVYSTAMGALILEVYYRYERVRSRGREFDIVMATTGPALDDRSAREQKIRKESMPPAEREEMERKEREAALAKLEEESEFERWSAVRALADIGHPDDLPAVIELIGRHRGRMKGPMIAYLGRWKLPLAAPVLVDYLEDGDAAVRKGAVSALRDIFGRDLQTSEAWRRWWAIRNSEDVGAGNTEGEE